MMNMGYKCVKLMNFKTNDYVIFRNKSAIIMSTELVTQYDDGDLNEHIIRFDDNKTALCYNYSLTYDTQRIRLLKLKKLLCN